MSEYAIYKHKFLFVLLDDILIDDLMKEAEFVHDIVNNPIKRIVV